MKARLLKAQAKKKKFLKRVEKIRQNNDSDGELSSDDEQEVSTDFIGKLINEKYLVVKYLSRGTFCKVWMVYDLVENQYYALKVQDDEDQETLLNEIKMLNLVHREGPEESVCYMSDYFDIKINGVNRKAILLELLGNSLGYLTYEENDNLIDINIVKKITKSLLESINCLHKKNMVHCDLKLDNILFCEYNNNIKSLIKNINELELHDSYNTILQQSLNNKLVGLNKSKRKVAKKKIKKRIVKELIKENSSKIIEINNKNVGVKVNNLKEINIDDLENEKEENKEDENKYLLDINLDNPKLKLLDLGNTEIVSNKNDEEIYTRSYRPPENIINGTFDTKSDIWVIGCMLYELITGDVIFDFDNCDKVDIDKDRFHLAQMYSLLGKMPKEMSLDCEYSEDYFDMKGRILKNKNIEMRDLKDELTNRIELDDEDLDLTYEFLLKLLEYDPNIRLSAEELLNHKWLETNENLNMEII